MPYTEEWNKYSAVFKRLGCNVERVENTMIIDKKYKVHLSNSRYTNLETGEKGWGIKNLEDEIKDTKGLR